MTRILLPWILISGLFGCDGGSSTSQQPPPRPPAEVAKQPLSAAAMRAMFAAGEPCIRKFAAQVPGSYSARVWASRSKSGFLTLEFRSGDRAEFNACIVDAIAAARIPVELDSPVEVPLVFDLAAK